MIKKVSLSILTIALFTFSKCEKNNECASNPIEDCMCTMEYDPVCGCNDKTYGNACAAECDGITSYSSGECQ